MSNVPGEDSIDQQIEKITSFIETAQRLIYQSKTVDLKALEERIDILCEALKKLPPKEASILLPSLEKIFESVQKLENDIDLQHDALTERLQFSERRANPLMAQEVSDDENQD